MASGSSKRQRTKQVLVRFTETEFTEVLNKADQAGFHPATWLRHAALGRAGPRTPRRAPADQQVLRQLLGECGRIGNNINQIARHLNAGGEFVLRELQDAVSAYLDIRNAILAALSTPTAVATATPKTDDHQGQKSRGR